MVTFSSSCTKKEIIVAVKKKTQQWKMKVKWPVHWVVHVAFWEKEMLVGTVI
jgi:hypothetical protein